MCIFEAGPCTRPRWVWLPTCVLPVKETILKCVKDDIDDDDDPKTPFKQLEMFFQSKLKLS